MVGGGGGGGALSVMLFELKQIQYLATVGRMATVTMAKANYIFGSSPIHLHCTFLFSFPRKGVASRLACILHCHCTVTKQIHSTLVPITCHVITGSVQLAEIEI